MSEVLAEGLEQAIKKVGLENGAKIVGIARASDFAEYAPQGHRPEDLLRGAKSVIVFGGQTLTAGAWLSPDPRIMASNKIFGIQRKTTALKTALWIEKECGYPAVYYDGGRKHGLVPFMSLKLAAELAGFGTRAMAGGVILNPVHGLLNLACVVTTLPLEPDGRMTEPVCPHPACVKVWEKKGVTPCLEICPECLEGELKEGRIDWMRFRRYRCMPRATTASVQTFPKLINEAMNIKDPEQRKLFLYGEFFTRTISSIGFSNELVATCFKCLSKCPYCLNAARLTPKR